MNCNILMKRRTKSKYSGILMFMQLYHISQKMVNTRKRDSYPFSILKVYHFLILTKSRRSKLSHQTKSTLAPCTTEKLVLYCR